MKPRFLERRDVSERVELSCDLILKEPALIGGAEADSSSDRPLLRDGLGRIYIAGTTLKGVLRDGLRDSRLFGDSDTGQAWLFVDDAFLIGPKEDEAITELRDGVAIDPKLGIAEEGKKYDLEVLAAGHVFRGRFELFIPTKSKDAALIKSEACQALEKLSEGVAIGARTRRGFGLTVRNGDWEVRNWSGAPGLKARLAERCKDAPASWKKSVERSNDLCKLFGVSLMEANEQRIEISLEFKICGSLLIRSPVLGEGPADVVQLHAQRAGGQSVPTVSGSSLAGVLRSRCLRIARTLLDERSADCLVEGLFGPVTIKDGRGRASRLRVGEAAVESAVTLRHTRVRIDPWTGGASDALLFSSEPVYGGEIRPLLKWTEPAGDSGRALAEKALLLLALRDMALGDLRVGGEGAVGRGVLKPLHEDGSFGRFGAQTLRLTPELGLEGDFNKELEALKGWGQCQN